MQLAYGRAALCCQCRLRSQSSSTGLRSSRNLLVAHAEADAEGGVRALLERDRRTLQLPDDPFAPADSSAGSDAAAASSLENELAGSQAAAARAAQIRSQEQGTMAEADAGGPKTAGMAIALGMAELQAGRAGEAVALFERALELPGRGAFRLQGIAREHSCASEGEEIAALYNMACAYAALGETDAALTCLEGALEAGFSDLATLRSDPDFRELQGPALERLLSRHGGGIGGVFGKMLDRLRK